MGKVQPPSTRISLYSLPVVTYNFEGLGQATFATRVDDSEIRVVVTVDTYVEEYFPVLYGKAFEIARACVDAVAFAIGQGVTISLDTYAAPGQSVLPIYSRAEGLSALVTAYKFPGSSEEDASGFREAMKTLLSDPRLCLVLNDLIQANTVPYLGSVNCARAVEGIRHLIAPGETRAVGWAALKLNLNLEHNFLNLVTDLSTGPRHGDPSNVKSAAATEALRRAWLVFNRYLEFKKNGRKRLELEQFPVVTDGSPVS